MLLIIIWAVKKDGELMPRSTWGYSIVWEQVLGESSVLPFFQFALNLNTLEFLAD